MAAPFRHLNILRRLFPNKDLKFINLRKISIRKLLATNPNAPSNSSTITIHGWVKSVRRHKDVVFMDINDGSCNKHLQVVTEPSIDISGVTYGCSVEVEGSLSSSKGAKQSLEFKASSVKVQGSCDPVDFPFKVGRRHPVEYERQFPHLRPRTQMFSALSRVRSEASRAIHEYFQENDYCQIHAPIITSNDCEGAGELFKIEPANREDVTDKAVSGSEHFFNTPAYLTVSGQLHLEAMAGAMSRVYTFGPTFRAENSRSRHHLSEFYMVEAEVAFIDSLDFITQTLEDLYKSTIREVSDRRTEDVDLFHKKVAPKNHKEIVSNALSDKAFPRLTYTEAIETLQKSSHEFKFKPEWGVDLQREHERFLLSHCDNSPLFITDFPKEIKPFYAQVNDDGKTVAAVDMLAPGVGEIVGGSLREKDFSKLKCELDRLNLTHSYEWYLDLRKYGTTSHGGFGLGFERFLQTLLGIANIKDTLPFPRFTHNCKM